MSENTKAVSDMLKTRMREINTVVKFASTYLQTIEALLTGMNPAEYSACKNAIAVVIRDITEIPLISDVELETLMKVYQRLSSMEEQIDLIFKTINNPTYMKMAMYNMSTTYTINIRMEKARADDAYEKYKNISSVDNEKIFNIVFSDLSSNDAFSFISRHSEVVNSFTITLLGRLIKIVTGEQRRVLESIVEKQKDMLFGSTRITGDAQRLSRFGLNPVTKSMSLSDLLVILDKPAKKDPKLEMLTDETTGVILINHASLSPIEFDIRGLIDPLYITEHNLKTPPDSGLNNKILERYNTAHLLKRADADKYKNPLIVKIGDTDPKKPKKTKWYVVETINGELYRLLGKKEPLLASEVSGLLNGVSTRAHDYNKIQSDEILRKCFDPKSQMLTESYIAEKIVVASSEPVKNIVLTELVRLFKEEITSAVMEKRSNLSNILRLAINKETVEKVLLALLPHKTGIHGKGTTEYLITYVCKMDTLIYKFYREIERKYTDLVSPRVISEKAPDELLAYIMDGYTRLIQKAMDELDTDNMWTEYDLSLKGYIMEQKQIVL